jgi:hypothetical protein
VLVLFSQVEKSLNCAFSAWCKVDDCASCFCCAFDRSGVGIMLLLRSERITLLQYALSFHSMRRCMGAALVGMKTQAQDIARPN